MDLQSLICNQRTCISSISLSHSRVKSFILVLQYININTSWSSSMSLAALRTISLEDVRWVAMSANLNCRYWNSLSFLPNYLRSVIYYCAVSNARAAPPRLQLAMLIRPPSRAFIANLNPSPRFPTRLDLGTLQSQKFNIAVGELRHPIFSSSFPKVNPFNYYK